MRVFQQQQESKYENYMAGLDVPNIKNASRGMAGVFGMGDTGGGTGGVQNNLGRFPDIWLFYSTIEFNSFLLYKSI